MANRFSKGIFTPKNPEKYIGKGTIIYRSSWELTFMEKCDTHPSILKWASEAIKIPYVNPLTRKRTVYVPDFLIVVLDSQNRQRAELIEIKPYSQISLESAGKSSRNQAQAIINMAKWEAARAFCKHKNMSFRIITEHDMFHGTKRPKK